MSLFDDIIKGLPENTLLRAKVREAEAENDSLKQENASLKDDLRHAKAEIVELKKQIERAHTPDLHEAERGILIIASEGNELYSDWLAERLKVSQQRAEYHLQELVMKGYLEDSFGYPISQKGRKYLIDKDLL